MSEKVVLKQEIWEKSVRKKRSLKRVGPRKGFISMEVWKANVRKSGLKRGAVYQWFHSTMDN